MNPTPLTRTAPFSAGTARTLLERYGSPLYVYDAATLRDTIRRVTRAFSHPRTRFHFASVVNGNLSLLKIFRGEGWGLHANTPGDVYLGLHAGFAPEEIVFSGGNLSPDELRDLLDKRVGTLNLDSLDQLRSLVETIGGLTAAFRPRLGFRVNLPRLTGETRTGVRPTEFPEAVRLAAEAGLKITGLHFYRGTGTNSTEAFTRVVADVLETANLLPDWSWLDFGGGFGYAYHANRPGFDWNEFGGELSKQLAALDRPIDLVVEPGRAAVAQCGTLLARVVSVKRHDGRQIVGTDTTVANIAVLAVHGGRREAHAFNEGGERIPTDVCGNTTFSRDFLSRGCLLPAMKAGDLLAILDVGAYGYAMASHFLHRPRPAEVLLEDGEHRLIRRREDYSVLTAHQVVE